MTKQQALDRLWKLRDSNDEESAHVEADNILCDFLKELGHDDIAIAFEAVPKWYA